MLYRQRRQVIRWLLGIILLLGFSGAVAASRVAVSQGYMAPEPVPANALVSLDTAGPNSVVLASTGNVDKLVGVVIQPNESLLSESSSDNQVQVAIRGIATVLVSDSNGTVKQGDKITASPIKGVGMRTTDNTRILGVAQSNLADATDKQTLQIKTKDGKTQAVVVGKVMVQVDVNYYNAPGGIAASYLPPIVRDLSNTVAGKQVSPIRVILSFILLLVAILISIVLVYSAVRSSIISIGRNPLSQPAVRRSLLQVFGFVLVILLVTLISVYLILSR